MELNPGSYRRLTREEKEKYPEYKYVITRPYHYKLGEHSLLVPTNFLTNGCTGGPDVGISWIYHDYLYGTHRFTSGQVCTRYQADLIMHQILDREGYRFGKSIFWALCRSNPLFLFTRAWNSGTPDYMEN